MRNEEVIKRSSSFDLVFLKCGAWWRSRIIDMRIFNSKFLSVLGRDCYKTMLLSLVRSIAFTPAKSLWLY